MLQTKLLESITLERQPCCIAFSPIHPEVFIVGTYELKNSEFDGSIMKDGNLVVYHLEHGILYVMSSFVSPISLQTDADYIGNMFKPFPSLSPSSTCAFLPTSHKTLRSLQALARL